MSFKKRDINTKVDADTFVLLRAVRVVATSLGITLATLIAALVLTVMDLHNTQRLLLTGRTTALRDAANADQAARTSQAINTMVGKMEDQLIGIQGRGGTITVQLCALEANWEAYAKSAHLPVNLGEPPNIQAICSGTNGRTP